jgi:hypothetical protein
VLPRDLRDLAGTRLESRIKQLAALDRCAPGIVIET